MKRARLAAAILAALSLIGCENVDFVVVIGSDGSERLTVQVETAETAEARTRGLRGRSALSAGEGLLIVLPAAGEVCVVNDGVAFAIDAVFISEAREVIAVERAIPAGDATRRCREGTRYVLEVLSGVAAGVSTGNEVRL